MRNAIILIILTAVLVVSSIFIKNKFNPKTDLSELGQDSINNEATTTDGFIEPKQDTAETTTNSTIKTTITTKPAITKDGIYIIYYENTGFKPISLEIVAGKSVRFINNSSKALLIYANNQQDRTLASINQSKSIGKGGVYNFMFTQPGIYGYYNVNNPRDTGVITVK